MSSGGDGGGAGADAVDAAGDNGVGPFGGFCALDVDANATQQAPMRIAFSSATGHAKVRISNHRTNRIARESPYFQAVFALMQREAARHRGASSSLSPRGGTPCVTTKSDRESLSRLWRAVLRFSSVGQRGALPATAPGTHVR